MRSEEGGTRRFAAGQCSLPLPCPVHGSPALLLLFPTPLAPFLSSSGLEQQLEEILMNLTERDLCEPTGIYSRGKSSIQIFKIRFLVMTGRRAGHSRNFRNEAVRGYQKAGVERRPSHPDQPSDLPDHLQHHLTF